MAKNPVIKKAKKDNSTRNGLAAFGVTLLLYASAFGLKDFSSLLVGGLLSLLVSTIVRIATKPMKGLEAPSSSAGVIADRVPDELARQVVLKGLENLDALQKERLAINEYDFTRRLTELHSAYRELLNQVLADNGKAPRLTELNSYYMPTLLTLLRSYRSAKSQGASYMDAAATRADLIKTMDQLILATRTLKKKMVQVDLDATRIKMDVLFNNLQASGLIVDERTSELAQAAAEAAATLPVAQQLGTPVKAAQPRTAPVQPVARQTTPAPQAAPVQKTPVPTVAMGTPAAAPAQAAPTLPVSAPTASAAQLSQGAPVLYVPGLLDDKEPEKDDRSTLML